MSGKKDKREKGIIITGINIVVIDIHISISIG